MKNTVKRKEIEGNALEDIFKVKFEDLDFSSHALKRMRERDFSFDDVMNILCRPLRIARMTQLIVKDRWSFIKGKRKVVVDMDSLRVVTVLRLKKVKKVKSDAKERHERSMARSKRTKDNFTKQFTRGRFQEDCGYEP